jgi:hypothetical protein
VEQAIKDLTYLIDNSGPHRQYISIQLDIVESMLKLIVSKPPLETRRNLAVLLLKLSEDGNFPIGLNEFEKLLPVFKRLLYEDDEEVLTNVLWGISEVVGTMGDYPRLIVDAGVNNIKLF